MLPSTIRGGKGGSIPLLGSNQIFNIMKIINKKFTYLLLRGEYQLICQTDSKFYAAFTYEGRWNTIAKEGAFLIQVSGARELKFQKLPVDLQKKWIEFLQSNKLLKEVYAIGSVSNTSFICDLEEDTMLHFEAIGAIRELTHLDNMQGNAANYVVTDNKWVKTITNKSLTNFLNE